MVSPEPEILPLLKSVPSPPGEPLPAGASRETIAGFEKRSGIAAPQELRDWLTLSNGPCVGPGGLFGIRPTRKSLDIEVVFDLYPIWKEKQWIPIAGDGTGNYYVLDAGDSFSRPVLFIDTHEDPTRAAYAVASGLWSFLRLLLQKELGFTGWPFDKAYVLREDPRIALLGKYPMPWNA